MAPRSASSATGARMPDSSTSYEIWTWTLMETCTQAKSTRIIGFRNLYWRNKRRSLARPCTVLLEKSATHNLQRDEDEWNSSDYSRRSGMRLKLITFFASVVGLLL